MSRYVTIARFATARHITSFTVSSILPAAFPPSFIAADLRAATSRVFSFDAATLLLIRRHAARLQRCYAAPARGLPLYRLRYAGHCHFHATPPLSSPDVTCYACRYGRRRAFIMMPLMRRLFSLLRCQSFYAIRFIMFTSLSFSRCRCRRLRRRYYMLPLAY